MNFKEIREQGLSNYYNYNKLQHKGWGGFKGITRGFSRTLGNLTGGLLGTSSQEKAQKRAMNEQNRLADEANRIQREQFEAETKRRAEEHKRAMVEAQRAREEAERLAKQERERVEAENKYNRELNQDTGTLRQNAINEATRNNNLKTSVDYSGSTLEKLTNTDKDDEDLDKLRRAFKFRL